MPPEEIIARRILADAFQSYVRGPLNPAREAELRDLIAAAIREAALAEREACAAACDAEVTRRRDKWSEVYDGCRGFPDHQQGAFLDGLSAQQSVCEMLARAIRARGKQP